MVGSGSFLALKVGNRPGKWFQNGSLAKKEGELKNAKEIKKARDLEKKGKRTGEKGWGELWGRGAELSDRGTLKSNQTQMMGKE